MSRVRLDSSLKPKYLKKTYFFILGKRLYCPCLSFSEAVTKESLGLSREADEGEEEVCRIILHINVFSPDCEEFCLCRTPLLVLSPWLSALPPCPGMLCQGSHCPPRRSLGSCLRLSALPLCPGKDVAYEWRYACYPLLSEIFCPPYICVTDTLCQA